MQSGTQNQTKPNFFDIIFTIFESKEIIAFTMLVGIIFLFTNYSGMLHYIHPDNEKVFVYFELIRIIISHFDSLFFALTTCIIIFQSKDHFTKILFCFFESSFLFLNLGRDKIPTLIGVTETDAKIYLVAYVALFSGFAFFYLGMLAKTHRQAISTANAQNQITTHTAPPEKQEQPQEKQNTPHPSPTDGTNQPQKRIIVKGLYNADDLPKNQAPTEDEKIDTNLKNEFLTALKNNPKIMELNKTEDTAQKSTEKKKVGRKPLTEEKKQEVKEFINENPNASLREVEKATDVSHTKANQLKKQLDIFG
jgi:hypothetical protein